MKYSTQKQLEAINAILTESKQFGKEKELATLISQGRAKTFKMISISEANQLIRALSTLKITENFKAIVINLAYNIGIIKGKTQIVNLISIKEEIKVLTNEYDTAKQHYAELVEPFDHKILNEIKELIELI